MIVVRFARNGVKYAWFINDNWAMIISFLLTMGLGIVFRRIKNSTKNDDIQIPNLKGGTFVDDCIDPDSVYEVVDPSLEITIRQMLNVPPALGPVIISVPVFILSYLVSRQPIKQITILGVNVFVDRVKNLALKTAIGIGSGSIFFLVPVGVVSLTGALLAGAIALNVVQDITNFECSNFVSKVAMERNSEGKIVGFLERPPEKNPRIFIKENEDIEIYFPILNKNEYCSSEQEIKKNVEQVTTKPETTIRRTYSREYVPLKKRTKTLSDLKRLDSTENREKADPYIKRYEDSRKRIKNKE